ncbi:MAG TPA: hypothetical protein VHB77_07015, partial [Planctomycetaceae bacterium]|nr:hypothetical protein [Planctomycetaceae bacterium]
ARSVIDFSASYDVVDSSTQTKLGVFRREGMKSILRDSWVVLDEDESPIGTIQEDSSILALVRRVVDLGNLIPQTFHLRDADGVELARYQTHFNPFVHRMTVSVFPDCHVNPLLVLAGGILLMAIEGRQT